MPKTITIRDEVYKKVKRMFTHGKEIKALKEVKWRGEGLAYHHPRWFLSLPFHVQFCSFLKINPFVNILA
ncbi:MAG TPA: hypothetical protein EYP68_01955 [Candidatus Korarchaeota archaeon]|nr:hypothetical protein [Candidatus Korarchaeota archaeon]